MRKYEPIGVAHARILIKENAKTRHPFLDLGNCQIVYIEEVQELLELVHLEELNFGSRYFNGENWISSINDFGNNYIRAEGAIQIATHLKNLKSLFLGSNEIGFEGAKAIAENLTGLSSLDLRNNFLGYEGAEVIAKNLPNLTIMNLWSNNLDDTAAEIIAEHLKNLKALDLGSNSISSNGARAIAENLKELITLNLWSNNIGDEGARHIAENLKNLSSLNLSYNHISDAGVSEIAGKIKGLKSLYLRKNNIGNRGAYAIAENLSNLKSLDLESNEIDDAGAIHLVEKLRSLSYINLENNNTTRILPEILQDIRALQEYRGIPPGEESVEHSDAQLIPNNTTKMILIGNSSSGKTTLANFLATNKKKFLREHNSTHGIQCWTWKFRLGKVNYKVNIRDFGGQDYFHATHNLFLDKESLFLLIHTNESVHDADCKEGEQFHSPSYWMGNISDMQEQLGLKPSAEESRRTNSDSSIWFVQNKTDHSEYNKEWFPSAALRQELPVDRQFHISIKQTSETKGNPPLDWKIFEASLKKRVTELCQTEIPLFWAHIRDQALPQWRKSGNLYFSRSDFSEACKHHLEENNIPYRTANGQFDGLLTYLKGSGELIHFENSSSLQDYVFLGVDKLTDYLFNKILTKKVKQKGGIFKVTDINRRNPDEAEIFIDVLKEYELVFPHPSDESRFVAPQYLPENPHMQRFMKLLPMSFALKFPDYMPRHFISRFISRFAQENKDPHFWKNGVFFERDGVHCMVRADLKEQIIYVHTEDKKDRFSVLKYIFEFFTRSCYGLPVEEAVHNFSLKMPDGRLTKGRLTMEAIENPYMQELELSFNGMQFNTIKTLQEAIKAKAQKVVSGSGSYMDLNATVYQLLNNSPIIPKRLFLCYSHADEVHLNDLKAHMSGPEMSGLIDVWYDREIDGGQVWDDVIREELRNADIVLLLLSHSFMKSRYIWETEIPRAKEAGAKIIPVFLSPVYYKEEVQQLYNLQGIPTGERFILGDSWKNKHQAYMHVVEEIVKLLEDRSDLRGVE